jgi:type IV pilus assembly protein PilO
MSGNNMVVFILLLIFSAGAGGHWYFTVYQEFITARDAKQQEIDKVTRDIEGVEMLKDELERVTKEYEQKKKEMAILVKNIQTDQQVPDILKKVENITIDNKVNFKEIRISPLIEYEGYSEIPIEFVLEGGYHDIGRFMASLENLKIFNVNAGIISISQKGKVTLDPKTNTQAQMLSVALQVKAFLLSESGELSSFIN